MGQAIPGGEPDMRTLDPRQRWVWTVAYGAVAVVVAAAVLVVDLVASVAGDAPWPPGALAVPVAVVAGALVWLVPRAVFDRWRYRLGPTTLELQRGVVIRTHTAIPYHRVQHIDITRSPVERRLGMAQLVLRTAAAGTDAKLPGVDAADADELRDTILARAGRGDV